MDIASLLLGILSLFFNPLGFISLMGLYFVDEYKDTNGGQLNGVSWAGLALNIFSLAFFVISLLMLIVYLIVYSI